MLLALYTEFLIVVQNRFKTVQKEVKSESKWPDSGGFLTVFRRKNKSVGNFLVRRGERHSSNGAPGPTKVFQLFLPP